jgi:prevent-host-death family protein
MSIVWSITGAVMRISVIDAKNQLTDLVKRAGAGEEIILTQDGHAVARLVAFGKKRLDAAARRQLLEEISAAGSAKTTQGPSAARSQDFLYDEDGLPK